MNKNSDKLNLAIPDGHLMTHVLPFIKGAGISFDGYDTSNLNRRPLIRPETDSAKQKIKKPDLVATKVIRPQDMPMHVANGNFDIAISGTDWLDEHKKRFPNSPLEDKPLLKLGFGKVKIVAAVHKENGSDLSEYIKSFRFNSKNRYFKIASEYVYIADHYANKNKFHPYRIIMTYGATESLIPEDCDMIIENTETGNTLRKNNLVITDVLMQSEGCLIANKISLDENSEKKDLILGIKELFEDHLNNLG